MAQIPETLAAVEAAMASDPRLRRLLQEHVEWEWCPDCGVIGLNVSHSYSTTGCITCEAPWPCRPILLAVEFPVCVCGDPSSSHFRYDYSDRALLTCIGCPCPAFNLAATASSAVSLLGLVAERQGML